MLTITECEQACGRASKIDHNQKKSCQGIDPEMSTKPRQAKRQRHARRGLVEQTRAPGDSQSQRQNETGSVDNAACAWRPRESDGDQRQGQQRRDAKERGSNHHRLRVEQTVTVLRRVLI